MSLDQRMAVVAEARSWISTPYHHMGSSRQIKGRQLKGIGIDCAQILIETYAAAGVIDWFDTGPYAPDWNLHRSEERYLSFVPDRARELPVDAIPGPGDFVVWLHGRTFSHGGIVTQWPLLVHAYHTSEIVEEADYTKELKLQYIGTTPRPMKKYTMWDDQ